MRCLPVFLFISFALSATARADLTPEQSNDARALIAQFGSKEFAAREAAVEKLAAMGPDALSVVKKALAEAKDAEVKLRCEMVIKRIAAKAAGDEAARPARLVERRIRTIPAPPPAPGSCFGFYTRGDGAAWLVGVAGKKNRVVLNGKEFPLHDGVLGLTLSPDGRRAAAIVRDGDKFAVEVDGISGPTSAIPPSDPVFSDDSRRVAYDIRNEGDQFVVVDGVKSASCRFIVAHPCFSPDSKRCAWMINGKDGMRVVVDGVEGPLSEFGGNPMWYSRDGRHLSRAGATVVADEVSSPRHGNIWPLTECDTLRYLTLDDGELWLVECAWPDSVPIHRDSAVAKPDPKPAPGRTLAEKRVKLLGKFPQGKFPQMALGGGLPDSPVLRLGGALIEGPDGEMQNGWVCVALNGRHLWNEITRGGGSRAAWKGKEFPYTERNWRGSFSPDDEHVAVVENAPGGERVVCDGRAAKAYPSLSWKALFSPDSRHMAYAATFPDKTGLVVCDGVESQASPWLRNPYIANGKLRWLAGDDKETWIMEADWPPDRDWSTGLDPAP